MENWLKIERWNSFIVLSNGKKMKFNGNLQLKPLVLVYPFRFIKFNLKDEIIVYWLTKEKTNFYFLAYILINLVCVMFQSDLKKRNASHASVSNAFSIASLTVQLYVLDGWGGLS